MCDTSLTTSLPIDFVFARLAGYIKAGFPSAVSCHPPVNPWLRFPKHNNPNAMAVSASVFSFERSKHTIHVFRSRRPTLHVYPKPQKTQQGYICFSETQKSAIFYAMSLAHASLKPPSNRSMSRVFRIKLLRQRASTSPLYFSHSYNVSSKFQKQLSCSTMSVPAFSSFPEDAAAVALLYHQNM